MAPEGLKEYIIMIRRDIVVVVDGDYAGVEALSGC